MFFVNGLANIMQFHEIQIFLRIHNILEPLVRLNIQLEKKRSYDKIPQMHDNVVVLVVSS